MHAPLNSQQFIVPGTWPGLLKTGNIDLTRRPVVHNPDGSISTVKSASFGIGGGEVLAPQVVGRQVVSAAMALAHLLSTGQNLGTFDTPAHANRYAVGLHNAQARMYGGRR